MMLVNARGAGFLHGPKRTPECTRNEFLARTSRHERHARVHILKDLLRKVVPGSSTVKLAAAP